MKRERKFSQRDIARMDPNRVGESVAHLFHQIRDAAGQFKKSATFPDGKFRNVVVCAMGGSALGADVIRSAYADDLRVPVSIVNGYTVPGWADSATLVVLCSYSGTTEEVLACYDEVRERQLPAFLITEGGILADRALRDKTPSFVFRPKYNPSNQPRIGLGYTMAAFYLLFRTLKFIRTGADDLLAVSEAIPSVADKAYRFAQKTVDSSFIIISAEHLQGVGHVISNQLNETAKVFAPSFFISELNHHLLEGLESLEEESDRWRAVFLASKDYHPRIRTRFAITEKVFAKQGFRTVTVDFTGGKVEQALRALSFSSFWTYYLALFSGFNPSEIPWVDYFKGKLK